MITAKTGKLAVIGYPIGHSLSPIMHNRAIEQAGLDYVYMALEVAPQDLERAFYGLRVLGFRGFNVTIPHKSAIIPLLDEVDPMAKAIGAVNVVVFEDARAKGYNTDVAGFLAPLKEKYGSLEGAKVAVLGAGGAARAILHGLLSLGVSSIAVGARSVDKVRALLEDFPEQGRLHAFDWKSEAFAEELGADILVQTTPLGMYPRIGDAPPIDWSRVKKGALAYDIIYTPAMTKFLEMAKAHGLMTENGEAMFVGQGAEAFRLWTGVSPDQALMREVLRDALSKGR